MMRLRLQMLATVSVRCSWNRRISSAVAVSGERFKYAANRLQLLMWLLCVCGLSLRALMSSIMRWRSGLMASVLMGTLLSEVDDTSILRKRPMARHHCSCNYSPCSQKSRPPQRGYRGSDLVLWRTAAVDRTSALGRKQRFKLRHYRKAPAKAIAAAPERPTSGNQCERIRNLYRAGI